MARRTECQTPDAQYHTRIGATTVEVRVELPRALDLDEEGAKLLEDNLHNALELVLARYFA
jgi:hypothetical protein